MIQIAIVVFREILEISLILGILVAATKQIPGKSKWLLSGLGLGVISSAVLAFFTDKISESFDGSGQEIFNGIILLSAALMISWTILWMQKHAKELSGKLKKLGKDILEGSEPLYALLIVSFLSVLREGAEIVLFTYSYYAAGEALSNIIFGIISGVISGTAIGTAIYFGIIKTSGKYFFSVTTWILVFLAAGITAQAIGFLNNAGVIPLIADQVYDSSEILSQRSFAGTFLNIFFGYIDQPTGAQLIAYLATLVFLVTGLQIIKRKRA